MEPVKQPPASPEVPSAPPPKGRWKILRKGYEACATVLKNMGAFLTHPLSSPKIIKKPSSTSELLPISFTKEGPEGPPTMEALRAAHFRFHRLKLSSMLNFVGFGIIDGSTRERAFSHLMKNDWEPGYKVLLASSPSPELETKIKNLATIFTRASFFFMPQKLLSSPQAQAMLAKITLQTFKDGDCVILPGGTKDHAILYEWKKENGKWYLKIYNAGAGAELSKKRFDRFNVPCYEIEDINSLQSIVTELYALMPLKYDEVEKYQGALSHAVENIVTSHGGKKLPHEETHCLQDRGNCTVKSIIAWFHEQTALMTITITPEMVEAAAKYAPAAQKTLSQLVGKQISLNRFFKVVGYENVQADLDKIFFTNVGSQPSPEIIEKRKYLIYEKVSRFNVGKRIKQKIAKKYLSSLAKKIHRESAIERFEKKDRMHERTKQVDQVIDKLWSISHLGYIISG